MAALDPSQSPKRPKTPVDEAITSGRESELAESGCSLKQTGDPTCGKVAGNPNNESRDIVVRDDGSVAGHSEGGLESGAGAGETQCVSPEVLTASEKMAEAPGNEQRDFDWSEAEDDAGTAKKHGGGKDKYDHDDVTETAEEAMPDKHAGDDVAPDVDKADVGRDSRPDDMGSVELSDKCPGGEVDGGRNVVEDAEEADRSAKPKRCRLVCKECGKRFNRRETFNLHRHFHAHEDELTPLTCKECGLTFQHRSSLIKHRNEHKSREERPLTLKKEPQAEEGGFQCAECQRTFSAVGRLRDHSCSGAAEKPYHCPLCRQDFQFKVSVTKHMMTHSRESAFTCQECSQAFPNAMALRLHQRCHAALKPYECPECGMVFKHYSVMEDHRRRHTDSGRPHLCNTCGKAFKYSSLLHQHQYLHTGQKPFRCPECSKTFAFAQNMKAHCRQHRLKGTAPLSDASSKPAPVSAQEKENTSQNEETKRIFHCPLCPQTFCVPANLRAHMLIHEAEYEKLERAPQPPKYWEKGHTCPDCPSVYRDESSLKVHLLSVHKSTTQYLERFAPRQQFTPVISDNVQGKWKSESADIKSHKCSECGKAFRHRSVLELHMRIHSKDKPYQCKVCGKGFRFSSYLQQHIIIHTGKKPYKCPECGKEFAFLQNMRTHQKLHQEKPFRCTSCRKGYSDETQLQHHMLSHNGDKPHKCHLCEKSFGLAYLLRDHMNTHTGERPHRCDECHKTFSWLSSLLVHQKIHARKRQHSSQYGSLPAGARTRGRGRRGGRGGWGWSRPVGGTGMIPQQPLYPLSPLRDDELHRRQQPSSVLASGLGSQRRSQKEPWLSELRPQPVQWKVDGGEVMPVPNPQQQAQAGLQHQRGSGWADISLLAQSGPTSAQSSDHLMTEGVGSHPANTKRSSPSASNETVQHRQHKPAAWSSSPTSTAPATTSSGPQDFSVSSSYMDGAALWSVRPAPLTNTQGSPNKLGQELQLPRWSGGPAPSQKEPSTPPKKEDRIWDLSSPKVLPSTVTPPEKPWNGCEPPKPRASGSAGASTSAQIDQSSVKPIPTPASHGVGNPLLGIQSPPGIPKTINSSEKLVKNTDFQLPQKQASAGWAAVQTATQKVPISIQYEPHRFGQGMGTPVWGFQSNAVGPQPLLSAQLKAGSGQELQQQPMVTGTQIIINQPSPFFSPPLAPLPLALPGPHPLHSVAVGAIPRPPHPNIFFTPQAVLSERPHMPQTLSLPQLAPQAEPHKLGSRLPFAPERLLQCMICGCTLPRELDLQMHYLQHAQGEI
ncbi:unnamed protein product [Menidia menidia]|uniref:(Atlantic silverside) hypothetical protein n=1 Tax=Menidia menidia TaxID=238744 RepID=A0A8S4BTE7_9TELE|nr:unnamed protein product [Menidia menidia]